MVWLAWNSQFPAGRFRFSSTLDDLVDDQVFRGDSQQTTRQAVLLECCLQCVSCDRTGDRDFCTSKSSVDLAEIGNKDHGGVPEKVLFFLLATDSWIIVGSTFIVNSCTAKYKWSFRIMGRKPLGDSGKVHRMQVRVTVEEQSEIDAAAEAAGATTSAWVRDVLLAAARTQKKPGKKSK